MSHHNIQFSNVYDFTFNMVDQVTGYLNIILVGITICMYAAYRLT